MSQISRFHVVLKNWASLKRHWCIIRKDLGLHAFKIKLTYELKPLDHLKLLTIGLWQSLKKIKNIIEKSSSAIEWSPRSCDLTPLNFILWDHIKSLVYANKPATLDDLEYNIQTRNCQRSGRNVCQSDGKLSPKNRPL